MRRRKHTTGNTTNNNFLDPVKLSVLAVPAPPAVNTEVLESIFNSLTLDKDPPDDDADEKENILSAVVWPEAAASEAAAAFFRFSRLTLLSCKDSSSTISKSTEASLRRGSP